MPEVSKYTVLGAILEPQNNHSTPFIDTFNNISTRIAFTSDQAATIKLKWHIDKNEVDHIQTYYYTPGYFTVLTYPNLCRYLQIEIINTSYLKSKSKIEILLNHSTCSGNRMDYKNSQGWLY